MDPASNLLSEIRGWAKVSIVVIATSVLGVLVALVLRSRAANNRLRQRLPPGPRGWPLLGSLPLLGIRPHRSLYELAKQYGPLMFMHLGSVRTLVVTSPHFAEEILKTHDRVMSSRPNHIVTKELINHSTDIAWTPSGQHWRYLRKVVATGLLTPGRIIQFRAVREREVSAVLHFILEESKRGNPVNMTECLSTLTTNNMTQMMMSKSYITLQGLNSEKKTVLPAEDRWSTSLPECLRETFLLLGAVNIADYVPLLKPFDPQGLVKRAKIVHRIMNMFMEEIIEEHRQKLSAEKTGDYREDFVDALLGIGQTKEFQETLSIDVVKALLLDIVAAGGDTSSATALWALTELMRHPHMMRKVQEELNSVVGPNRLVKEEDLPQLKYLSAVVKETLRLYPAGPMMVPHESFEDCEVGGYHIPAGTRVFVNLWAMHRDATVWERALEFDPDRFLNSKLDYKGQDFEFIPFGSGRRHCPGMNIGALMVMYPLSLLLHAVNFELPEGQKPEDVDMLDTFGLVLYKKVPLTLMGKPRLANHVLYPAKPNQCNSEPTLVPSNNIA